MLVINRGESKKVRNIEQLATLECQYVPYYKKRKNKIKKRRISRLSESWRMIEGFFEGFSAS